MKHIIVQGLMMILVSVLVYFICIGIEEVVKIRDLLVFEILLLH